MSDNFWDALGSVATAAAFIAVAWQSVLTRKAVKVAENALVASQAVAVDTARARLDSAAPEVTVQVFRVLWPPEWPVAEGPPRESMATKEWRFPAEQNDRILLGASIRLDNLSGRYVTAEYDGDLTLGRLGLPSYAEPQTLRQGRHVERVFQKEFTIKDLSENYEARQAGRPLPHRVTGKITVHDSRDHGVSDTWEVELAGCPVRPDGSRPGVWVIDNEAGVGSMECTRPARQRTYWISRQQQQRLPEPSYNP
jgi:hypothetical protein